MDAPEESLDDPPNQVWKEGKIKGLHGSVPSNYEYDFGDYDCSDESPKIEEPYNRIVFVSGFLGCGVGALIGIVGLVGSILNGFDFNCLISLFCGAFFGFGCGMFTAIAFAPTRFLESSGSLAHVLRIMCKSKNVSHLRGKSLIYALGMMFFVAIATWITLEQWSISSPLEN